MMRRWTEQEKEYILRLVGVKPFVEIYINYVKYAQRLRLEPKSKISVRDLITKSGNSLLPDLDSFSVNNLASLLGTSSSVVRRFIDTGLKVRQCGNKKTSRFAIDRKDLKVYVLEHPHKFKTFKKDGLRFLFDQDVLELIEKTPHQNTKRALKIVEYNSGKVYESIGQASLMTGVSKSGITTSIRTGKTVSKTRWVSLDEDRPYNRSICTG